MPVLTHPLYLARQPVGVDAPLMASSLTLGLEGSLTRIKGWTGGRSDVIGVQVFGTMVPSEEFAVRLVDDAARRRCCRRRRRRIHPVRRAGACKTWSGPETGWR